MGSWVNARHILGALVRGGASLRGSKRDPIQFIARQRERNPVCWIPVVDAWLVTRHEDVRRLFADSRLTADPQVYARYRPPSDPRAARWLSELPFRSTPSDPQSLGRRLVTLALTPRAMARVEDRVRAAVERFAAPLRGRRGVVDLMGEFTVPVAATAIGGILGVPPKQDDERRFRKLAARATRAIRPVLSEKQRDRMERASAELAEYVLGLVEERGDGDGEDLICDLLRAARDGGRARREDVVRIVTALVAAGVGTTAVATARALRSLLRHPEQLALLRGDESLLPGAVNELLRYDSGLLVMPRYVAEGFEFRGRRFAKGQLVALSMLGANRDPRVFDDPDRLDLRRDTKEALSFGYGPHYCIGANLARLEIREMIAAALRFLPPGARLLEDQIRWSARGLLSQIKSLPVDFGP